ncbi:MAG TPA: T9SS type A sorting domain-containing protein [Flavobacterium sp.]|jgi:hypothetical protein
MKWIITPAAFLLTTLAGAQLYVSPNSYMYDNGQVLYVKQDVNLQNNGNIYLRNEAQLLQGTSGTSTNKGLGKLSVFQEGTSDNYDYNYWCSPIGNASASTGNESFGITMLHRPATVTASTAATMLSMTALDGTSSPLAIAPRWIYKYINSILYSEWIQVGTASSLAPGEGFTMKGTSGTDGVTVNGVQNNPGSKQRYDFRGKPNDGNITVTVGMNNQTLTGNPYPSALHVNAFLLDPSNTACDGIAYYWEQNKSVNSHFLAQYQGGYGTYSPVSVASNGIYVPATFDTYDGSGNLNTAGTSSGLSIARKYAPIGQGFMVKGATSGSVTLKNIHRIYYKESTSPLSFFEKTSIAKSGPDVEEPISHIRLNVILNNQFTRQVALAFIPWATDGPDRGIDAKSTVEGDLPNDVYLILQNEKYVIQGTSFDLTKRFPVGVKAANNSSFRFYVPEAVNFDESLPVYIYDAADGSYHNIRNGFYDVTLEQGIYTNRFEITFIDAALNSGSEEIQNIDVLQNNSQQQLIISNPGLRQLSSCSLYDITGKLVINVNVLGTDATYGISTAVLSDGVYIVKIATTDGQSLVKKISVARKTN